MKSVKTILGFLVVSQVSLASSGLEDDAHSRKRSAPRCERVDGDMSQKRPCQGASHAQLSTSCAMALIDLCSGEQNAPLIPASDASASSSSSSSSSSLSQILDLSIEVTPHPLGERAKDAFARYKEVFFSPTNINVSDVRAFVRDLGHGYNSANTAAELCRTSFLLALSDAQIQEKCPDAFNGQRFNFYVERVAVWLLKKKISIPADIALLLGQKRVCLDVDGRHIGSHDLLAHALKSYRKLGHKNRQIETLLSMGCLGYTGTIDQSIYLSKMDPVREAYALAVVTKNTRKEFDALMQLSKMGFFGHLYEGGVFKNPMEVMIKAYEVSHNLTPKDQVQTLLTIADNMRETLLIDGKRRNKVNMYKHILSRINEHNMTDQKAVCLLRQANHYNSDNMWSLYEEAYILARKTHQKPVQEQALLGLIEGRYAVGDRRISSLQGKTLDALFEIARTRDGFVLKYLLPYLNRFDGVQPYSLSYFVDTVMADRNISFRVVYDNVRFYERFELKNGRARKGTVYRFSSEDEYNVAQIEFEKNRREGIAQFVRDHVYGRTLFERLLPFLDA